MVWFVTGTKHGTAIEVSPYNSMACHGRGKSELRLVEYAVGFTEAIASPLRSSSCLWMVTVPADDPMAYDPNGVGLFDRVRASPDVATGMVRYHADASDPVGVVVVLPPRLFRRVYRLVEVLLLSESLAYQLTLGISTFRAPEVKTSTPTLDEFLHGRPYFFSEFRFWLSLSEFHEDA